MLSYFGLLSQWKFFDKKLLKNCIMGFSLPAMPLVVTTGERSVNVSCSLSPRRLRKNFGCFSVGITKLDVSAKVVNSLFFVQNSQ